jgi:flagellar basal body P-ring formation protein FlgA
MKLFRLLSLALLLAGMPAGHAAQQKFQSIASIKAAVGQFIQHEFHHPTDYQYNISELDSRLKLPLCEQQLSIHSQAGHLRAGRNSIGIKCVGDKKWTIYTSAMIKAFQNVLVLTQPVRRGEVITSHHISLQKINLTKLRRGFWIDPSKVINKMARRHLAAGTVINSNLISEPHLVKKGEKVTIQAASPRFHIRMSGVALMDGIKGQRIKVKNIKSKRVVQATVRQAGEVYVR